MHDTSGCGCKRSHNIKILTQGIDSLSKPNFASFLSKVWPVWGLMTKEFDLGIHDEDSVTTMMQSTENT